MKLLLQYLSVAAAGALGAVLRFFIGVTCGAIFQKFPVGTFFINISGSFLLGWFLAFAHNRAQISDNLRLAVAVGFVGAYTTFSTYMNESNSLLVSGQTAKALLYLIGSIVIGLLAVRCGIWVGER